MSHPTASARHAAGTSTSDQPPTWAPAAPAIALLTALGVLMVGQTYTVLALLHPMSTALGTTPGQAIWTATAFGFAYAAGFLVAGPLSDRYGSRAVITAGLVAATAVTLAVSAAPNLPTAVALRSLQGLTAATFAPSALSYVVRHIAPQRRGTALTCITSGMLAAAVIMQIGAQAVAAGLGWRAVFSLSAALMALSLIPVGRVLRPTLRHDTGGGLVQAFAAMPQLVRRPRLAALYLSTVALMSSFVAVYTAVAIAGPPSVAGNSSAILALRAGALPALVAVPLLAPAFQRLVSPLRAVLAFALAALAVATGSFVGGHTVPLAIALLLFVAAVAAAAPAVVETINATAPHAGGAAVALYGCSMFIGASLGPQLTGALIGLGFGGILRVVAAALALGVLLTLPALRHRHIA
ncbi:transport integral membrane protein [Streptomyces bingchenggensis BCW-1]|uniref:Transport integral membrane protein n=1 Tax=Streptomyces bingchenggensis (strain BCW-1) TaxID=749414 RepID=D7C9M1_STRBB|nr:MULTISPECIES: MFS transporter [Streptomyces]ADI12733.1 transport integral membrane protein [Streptomyces bingchenggensis BCW-1]